MGPMRVLVLLLLLTAPVMAEMPAPERFLDAEAVSVAVVQARPDDAGFQRLLNHAWTTIQASDAATIPGFLSLALKLMGRGDEQSGLLSFLPAQAVRVDRVEGGRLKATYAITVEGWQGFQGLFYRGLGEGPDGEPLPTREILGQTLILQGGDEVPVLARVKGTFLACPDEQRAEHAVKALVQPPKSPPQTRLVYALKQVDTGRDLYGAMLNRDGGLLEFLHWLRVVDLEKLRARAEGEDLDDLSRHVRLMAWDGDLVDDDRLHLHARFETDGEEAARRLADVLMATRQVLREGGRVDHYQVGTSGAEVDLVFTMIGFRQGVQKFLGKLSRPVEKPP